MQNPAIYSILQDMPLFDKLTQGQMKEFSNQIIIQKYNKNEVIYDIASAPEYVYLIIKGRVKLGVSDEGDKVLLKEISYEQEIFGENIFTESAIKKEFAVAMTGTVVYKIPIAVFRSAVAQNSVFANEVMSLIVTKLEIIESRLRNFVFKKVKERIVEYIYRIGLEKGINIGFKERLINHGLSHNEIALLTDTSRQTVARILNELKRENLIYYGPRKSSKILIRDMSLLENYKMA